MNERQMKALWRMVGELEADAERYESRGNHNASATLISSKSELEATLNDEDVGQYGRDLENEHLPEDYKERVTQSTIAMSETVTGEVVATVEKGEHDIDGYEEFYAKRGGTYKVVRVTDE